MKVRNGFWLLPVASMSLLLVACGGDDAPTEERKLPPNSDMTGRVADGYIVGATVCLDKNDNKACDSDEPQAVTVVGGSYQISGVTTEDMNQYPVVVEVPADAIDEDTGLPFNKPFVMTAPKGMGTFVSPLSTLVQAVLESNPAMSLGEAENVIKGQLGYATDSTVSLFKDYVESKADAGNANNGEYARLHKVAQVLTQALITNLESARTSATNAGVNADQKMDEIMGLVGAHLKDALATVAGQVDSAGDNLNPVTLAAAITAMDVSNIKADIEQETLKQNVTSTAVQTALQNGVFGFWSGGDWFDRSALGLTQDGNKLVVQDAFYDVNAQNWVNEQHVSYRLTAAGWGDAPVLQWPNGTDVSYAANGSATFSHAGTPRMRMTLSGADISGQSIQPLLYSIEYWQGYAPGMPAAKVFAPNSILYNAHTTVLDNLYQLWQTDAVTGVTCSDNGDINTYQGNCNVVYGGGASGPATSLSEMLYAKGTNLSTAVGNYTGMGGGVIMRLAGDLADGSGVAGFYKGNQYLASSWSKITVSGVEMIRVVPPLVWQAYTGDSIRVFSVHKGYVRKGDFYPVGATYAAEQMLNKAANDSVWNAWGQQAGALLGSWKLVSGGSHILIVFAEDGTYYHVEDGTLDVNGSDGMERGTYTFANGTLTSTCPVVDTNGEWGLSHANPPTCSGSNVSVAVSGDTLSLGGVDFTRVMGAANIIGSWRARQGSTRIMLTFMADGTYYHVEDGNTDVNGTNGMERGTYTFANGTLTSTCPVVDTNGEWGMSHSNPPACTGSSMPISINGDVMTLDGSLQFNRVEP